MKKKDSHQSTFLDKFIIEKIKQYREPQRKGTPRGVEIGLSLRKYSAAGWSLKNISLKELAEKVGVSYGLLRKWKTEKAFKEQIAELQSEFITHLSKHLRARGEKQFYLDQDYIAKPVEYLTENGPPRLTYYEFSDLKYYGKSLVSQLLSRLPKYYDTSIDEKLNAIESGKPISLTDKDLLLNTHRIHTDDFLNRLSTYCWSKKDIDNVLELGEKFKADVDKISIKTNLDIIGIEWKFTGTLKEDTLKNLILNLHCQSENFTYIDMDY